MTDLKIAVGISDFEKIRSNGFYYVDKSGLIAELLKNSSLNLMEIEQECGFTNTSNFYRLFKKQMGISPGEMRKKV